MDIRQTMYAFNAALFRNRELINAIISHIPLKG
jgi:hypothetical protein